MTKAIEIRDLAFRLSLRNIESATIVQAIRREHGFEATPAQVADWVEERLSSWTAATKAGGDRRRAKTVAAIVEANRELWTASAAPGISAAERASLMQAIARNEERLLRLGELSEGSGSPTPARYVPQARPGKCGARGRGEHAARFCDEDPVAGRGRCRIHGGASPQGAAHPRFKDGIHSRGSAGLEIFTASFTETEQKLIERWRREPEDALRLQLAEGAIVQRRAQRAGNVEAYARLGTMIATTARALVSLREVPPPERGLPKVVHMFEGKTAADFEHDLELLRREAEVPA